MTALSTSREIPATVEQVFAAFSHPERLARWWGPAGFTNTFSICEPKTGGRWSFTMHGPDGRDYRNESVFEEMESPRKIVIQHVSEPKYRLTITFERPGVASGIRHIVVPANEQNLDRLTVEVLRKPGATGS